MRKLFATLVLLGIVAGAAMASQPARVGAASSSVTVNFDVTSGTVLDVTGCADGTPGVTGLSALPGSATVSSSDCDIAFGSTNNSSSLLMYQEDGTGTAMAGPGSRSIPWTSLNTGTTQHLRALTALPDGRIWASGYNATLIYSADGGNNWSSQANPADDVLRDLYAVDGNVIWGTGWSGNVIRTIDGGTTWTQVGKGPVINTYDVRGGVRALDDQTAWVGGSAGRVFKTTDGGASWTEIASGLLYQLWGMEILGTQTLFVVGEGQGIARSDDGGATWTVQRQIAGAKLNRIDVYDTNHAVAAGSAGLVVSTTDGGSTWNTVTTPTVEDLDGVVMFSPSHWLIVGYNGTIIETWNSGSSWITVPAGTTNNLRALWAPDETSIWAVGNGGVAQRAPVTPIDDYDDTANHDFATPGAGFFGVCLRAVASGASTDGTTWTPNATCPQTDGTYWNDVPPTSGSPGITVAKTAAPIPVGVPGHAYLRFGARPPASASPGQYRARIIVAVQAP